MSELHWDDHHQFRNCVSESIFVKKKLLNVFRNIFPIKKWLILADFSISSQELIKLMKMNKNRLGDYHARGSGK